MQRAGDQGFCIVRSRKAIPKCLRHCSRQREGKTKTCKRILFAQELARTSGIDEAHDRDDPDNNLLTTKS